MIAMFDDVHMAQHASYVSAGPCEMSWLGKRTPGATAHVGPAFAAESMAASSGAVIAAIMSQRE